VSASNWRDCPQCDAEDELREDYEFYWSAENEIIAEYGCSCQKCNFKFSFKHTKKPPIEPPINPIIGEEDRDA
jgi:hypothetical protein